MTLLVIFLGVVAAVVLLLAGIRDLAAVSARRRRLGDLLDESPTGRRRRLVENLDRSFRRTRPGRWVEQQFVLAGLDDRAILPYVAGGLAGGVLVGWILAVGLAPVFALGGLVAFVLGLRGYLGWARERRRERFVAQMPELARTLSNATNAGLSIASAVEKASQELAEPARTELARVSQRLSFGASLQTAIQELEERLPSREVSILVATLLVSARSGGSLVSALRDIAETLDARKEVRREVRTTLAQSTSTGYLVIGVGIAILFLLNVMNPGTVSKMTSTLMGQAALVVGGGLFVVGFLAIRKMTRFDG